MKILNENDAEFGFYDIGIDEEIGREVNRGEENKEDENSKVRP